jgi:hypothetical protein
MQRSFRIGCRIRLGLRNALVAVATGAFLSGCAYSSYEAHPGISHPVTVGIGSARLSKVTDLQGFDRYFANDGFVVEADAQLESTILILSEVKETSIDPRGLLRSSCWPGLVSILDETIRKRLAARPVPEIAGFTAQSASEQLTPFACMNVKSDGSVVVYAMIQADATEQVGSVKRTMRYYARLPERYVAPGLSGNNGGVDAFSDGMRIAFADAFQLFIDDIGGHLSTVRTARISVDLPRAPSGRPTTFEAAIVRESPDSLVFSLSAPMNPDRGLILVRPGEFEFTQGR